MINKLQNAIDNANNIVFFTGAGFSTASGIPDFRSNNGLYKQIYRSEEMLSHHFFMNNTKDFYEFYKNKMIYQNAMPNDAHKFISRLQVKKNVIVITQNIDGLHQLANSKVVYELHGSIMRNYCMNCHKFFDLNYIINSKDIPLCDCCNNIIKPDVVLYEEALDEEIIKKSIIAISTCDLLIVCGTSLNVYPAASFINYFKGDTLALINKDITAYDDNCDIVIHDDIVETFNKLSI